MRQDINTDRLTRKRPRARIRYVFPTPWSWFMVPPCKMPCAGVELALLWLFYSTTRALVRKCEMRYAYRFQNNFDPHSLPSLVYCITVYMHPQPTPLAHTPCLYSLVRTSHIPRTLSPRRSHASFLSTTAVPRCCLSAPLPNTRAGPGRNHGNTAPSRLPSRRCRRRRRRRLHRRSAPVSSCLATHLHIHAKARRAACRLTGAPAPAPAPAPALPAALPPGQIASEGVSDRCRPQE